MVALACPSLALTHALASTSARSSAVFRATPALGRSSARTHARTARVRAQPLTRAEAIMDPKTKELRQAPPGYQNAEERAGNKRAESLEDYEEIKRQLAKNLTTQGGVLSLYLALVVDANAGLSAVIGTGAAYLYLQLLSQYVDGLGEAGSWAPLTKETRDEQMRTNPSPMAILSWIPNRIGDIYRQALFQKRLLVLPAVTAACWGVDTILPDDFAIHPQLGFVLVGFLTYKTATLSWLWDNDIKPDLIDSITGKKEQDEQLATRPVLAKIPDTEAVLAAKGKTMD